MYEKAIFAMRTALAVLQEGQVAGNAAEKMDAFGRLLKRWEVDAMSRDPGLLQELKERQKLDCDIGWLDVAASRERRRAQVAGCGHRRRHMVYHMGVGWVCRSCDGLAGDKRGKETKNG